MIFELHFRFEILDRAVFKRSNTGDAKILTWPVGTTHLSPLGSRDMRHPVVVRLKSFKLPTPQLSWKHCLKLWLCKIEWLFGFPGRVIFGRSAGLIRVMPVYLIGRAGGRGAKTFTFAKHNTLFQHSNSMLIATRGEEVSIDRIRELKVSKYNETSRKGLLHKMFLQRKFPICQQTDLTK